MYAWHDLRSSTFLGFWWWWRWGGGRLHTTQLRRGVGFWLMLNWQQEDISTSSQVTQTNTWWLFGPRLSTFLLCAFQAHFYTCFFSFGLRTWKRRVTFLLLRALLVKLSEVFFFSDLVDGHLFREVWLELLVEAFYTFYLFACFILEKLHFSKMSW